jgi:hypothetical protein
VQSVDKTGISGMTPEDKIGALCTFLGRLPERVAVRLAKAIEVDRLSDGMALPHDAILDGLRPILRRGTNVARTATPLRLFCKPFEDLLVSGPRKEKQKGRIGRGSLGPVWKWLAYTLLPEAHANYVKTTKAAAYAYRLDEANAAAAAYWIQASQAMRAALEGDANRKAARLALNGEIVAADAWEISLMLAAGDAVRELHAILPKPTPALTEDLVWSLRGIYEGLLETAPDSAPYIAVAAMNRLAHPWEALRLPLTISRQTQDTLISSTDMGLVGEILLADMESHAVQIHAARHPVFDAKALVEHVAGFAALSNGLVKEIEMRRDGRWGQRLMKDRAAVAEMMESFVKRAPKEILAALPTLKTGSYAGGPRAPDLSHALDSEKAERARRYAALVIGCRPVAAAASFGAALADARDEVIVALRPYCEDIVKELRETDSERRRIAEQYFELAAELTTQFLSAEEGEFLRRRGRAAQGTPQAA